MKKIILFAILFVSNLVHAESWPTQPDLATDPGSASYQHQLFHETLTFDGRSVDFYAPQGFQNPAGFDAEYLLNVDPRIPITLTWADRDTVIKESLVQDIYNRLPSQKKQLIRLKSYQGLSPDLPADHFFPLTKKFSFGGRDGVNPLHYFGSWKWMLGAVWDLEAGGNVTNPYLYGEMTAGSGVNQGHTVQKNW